MLDKPTNILLFPLTHFALPFTHSAFKKSVLPNVIKCRHKLDNLINKVVLQHSREFQVVLQRCI